MATISAIDLFTDPIEVYSSKELLEKRLLQASSPTATGLKKVLWNSKNVVENSLPIFKNESPLEYAARISSCAANIGVLKHIVNETFQDSFETSHQLLQSLIHKRTSYRGIVPGALLYTGNNISDNELVFLQMEKSLLKSRFVHLPGDGLSSVSFH
jgi:hypothetical protein